MPRLLQRLTRKAEANHENEEPPLLPSIGAGSERDDQLRTIIVDGEPIKMDKFGPVVVDKDGALRCIDNWGSLSEAEQVVVLKKIGKRNRERLAAVKATNDIENQVEGT